MFQLPHKCTHLTHQQSNTQISPSQASTVQEPRTSKFSSWIQKRQRNQRSNCQHLLDHRKCQSSRKNLLLLYYLCQSLCVDHNKLTYFSRDGDTRSPYLTIEKSIRVSINSSQVWIWNNGLVPNWERSICQDYKLSPCLFNIYAEYIMRNARLTEAQAGIKTARKNINNLICRLRHHYGKQ